MDYSIGFVYCPPTSNIRGNIDLPTNMPMVFSILSSALKSAQITSKLADLNLEYLRHGQKFLSRSVELSLKAIDRIAADCDVFGFTSVCSSHALAVLIAKAVKKRYNKPIIFGGPQATLTAGQCMEAFPWIDYIVKHEGEITLPELMEALETGGDVSQIQGIVYRHGRQIQETSPRNLIENLDDSPFPDVDLIDIPAYQQLLGTIMIPIDNGRGCPYACSFCSTTTMWQRKVRVKSPQRVVAEMDAFHEKHNQTTFSMNHDTFTTNKGYIANLCRRMEKTNYRWLCFSRCDALDEELLQAMKAAGCTTVYLGIESGSRVERRRMFKHLRTCDINASIDLCLKHNVGLKTSYIIGFPNQTKQDLNNTLNAALRDASINAEADVKVLSPMPGTQVLSAHKDRLAVPPIFRNKVSPFFMKGDAAKTMKRMILRNPDIFSSYFILKPHSFSIEYMLGAEFLFNYLIHHFPITAFLLMRWSSYSPTDLLDRYLRYYTGSPLRPANIESVGLLLARMIRHANKNKRAIKDIFTYESMRFKLREHNTLKAVAKSQKLIGDKRMVLRKQRISISPKYYSARFLTDVHRTIAAITMRKLKTYSLKHPTTYIFYEDALNERLTSFPLTDPLTARIIEITECGVEYTQLIHELRQAFPQWTNVKEHVFSLLHEGFLVITRS